MPILHLTNNIYDVYDMSCSKSGTMIIEKRISIIHH